MTTQITNPKRPATSLSLVSFRFAALSLSAVATFGSALLAEGGQNQDAILFTDSQAAVLMLNGTSSTPAPVAVQNKLMQPFGVCVGLGGEYFVSDTGSMGLIGINPTTGEQRVVSSGGILGVPFGMAVDGNGNLVVANGQNIVRVDSQTGEQTPVSSNGFFRAPVAVAVATNGDLLVADITGQVIRVNPNNGDQHLVTTGVNLKRPQGIAVQGNDIFVTDVATPDGNFGIGIVIHIDALTGHQAVLSKAKNLVGPVGVAVGSDGNLVVADPYTINLNSPDIASGGYDGAIIQINRVSGVQKIIARGQGNFVNPRGVTIIQSGSRP
jgi:hypothetical protein